MGVDIFHKVETQHYVPRHYLSAWATRVCKKRRVVDFVACRIKNKLLSDIDTMTIGQDVYMYAYPDFSEYEFNVVVELLKSKKGEDGDVVRAIYQYSLFLPLYLRSLRGERTSELKSNICKLVDSGILEECFCRALIDSYQVDISSLDQEQLSEFIDSGTIAKNNGFEYWMTTLENYFNPLLDRARRGDLGFMAEAESRPAFIHNMINQMLRTQKFDRLALDLVDDNPCTNAKVAKYLRHLSAYDVASVIARQGDEYELNLICNNTALEFITGDQPLCNLVTNEEACQFDVYYPISPAAALFFSKKGRFDGVYPHLKSPSVHEVDALNKAICNASIDQVYAKSAEVLETGRYFAADWQLR